MTQVRTPQGLEVEVTNNAEQSRYEVSLDGQRVGLAAYLDNGNERLFYHTEVNPNVGGRGIGHALIQFALDDTRAAGMTYIPRCPFVAAFVRENPAYVAGVAERVKARFNPVPEAGIGG